MDERGENIEANENISKTNSSSISDESSTEKVLPNISEERKDSLSDSNSSEALSSCEELFENANMSANCEISHFLQIRNCIMDYLSHNEAGNIFEIAFNFNKACSADVNPSITIDSKTSRPISSQSTEQSRPLKLDTNLKSKDMDVVVCNDVIRNIFLFWARIFDQYFDNSESGNCKPKYEIKVSTESRERTKSSETDKKSKSDLYKQRKSSKLHKRSKSSQLRKNSKLTKSSEVRMSNMPTSLDEEEITGTNAVEKGIICAGAPTAIRIGNHALFVNGKEEIELYFNLFKNCRTVSSLTESSDTETITSPTESSDSGTLTPGSDDSGTRSSPDLISNISAATSSVELSDSQYYICRKAVKQSIISELSKPREKFNIVERCPRSKQLRPCIKLIKKEPSEKLKSLLVKFKNGIPCDELDETDQSVTTNLFDSFSGPQQPDASTGPIHFNSSVGQKQTNPCVISKQADQYIRQKHIDPSVRPKQPDQYIRQKHIDPSVRPKQHDSSVRPKQRDSYVRPKQRDSYVRPKQRDSYVRPKQPDSSVRPKHLDPPVRPKQLDLSERPKQVDPSERPKQFNLHAEVLKQLDHFIETNLNPNKKYEQSNLLETLEQLDRCEISEKLDSSARSEQLDSSLTFKQCLSGLKVDNEVTFSCGPSINIDTEQWLVELNLEHFILTRRSKILKLLEAAEFVKEFMEIMSLADKNQQDYEEAIHVQWTPLSASSWIKVIFYWDTLKESLNIMIQNITVIYEQLFAELILPTSKQFNDYMRQLSNVLTIVESLDNTCIIGLPHCTTFCSKRDGENFFKYAVAFMQQMATFLKIVSLEVGEIEKFKKNNEGK